MFYNHIVWMHTTIYKLLWPVKIDRTNIMNYISNKCGYHTSNYDNNIFLFLGKCVFTLCCVGEKWVQIPDSSLKDTAKFCICHWCCNKERKKEKYS